jgi:transposase-like protein
MPRRHVDTKQRVAELLDEGLNHTQIARALGVTKHTVAYHVRTLGRPADPRFTRRYDWSEVQRYYDEGHSVTECQERFGFARETWNAARRRGDVVPRPAGMPVEKLITGRRNRSHLKRRLVRLGLLEESCHECGITEWRGKPLSLCLHHVNAINDDNRIENLAVLCPNCHSQTENFAGRNRRAYVVEAEAA